MKITRAYYSREFKKKLNKYCIKDKNKFLKILGIFWQNPFDPSLKTHKLSGKLVNYWSFSLDYHLRILFQFIDDETVEFIDIGGHGIYK